MIKKKFFSFKLLNKVLSFREFFEILILPKIPSFKNDFSIKIVFIIIMIFKSLRSFHYENISKIKYSLQDIRYFLIGNILKIELNFLFNKLLISFVNLLKRKIISIDEFGLLFGSTNISGEIITNGLEYSIRSGIFSNSFFNIILYTSSQVFNRLSFLSTLSLLTKINSFVNKKRKMLIPRLVFPSNWCRICPYETPEGETCGLIKNFSIVVNLSITSLEKAVIYILIVIGLKNKFLYMISKNIFKKTTFVFINNNLIGFHENFLYFYYILKNIRKFLFDSIFFNINIEISLIYLNCDSGRLLRPLLTKEYYKRNFVSTIKKKIIFFKKNLINYFINNGMIELLDADEEYISIIEINELLMNNQTTHLEINPYCLFGYCLNAVPFTSHNQSPRNTYHSSMEKQNTGTDIINKLVLGKNTTEALWFPQRAIVTTIISNLYGIDLLGSAQNVIVSMLGSGTYDIEDALILNNSSKNLGLFRSSVQKCINFEKFPKLIKKTINFLFNISSRYKYINTINCNNLVNKRVVHNCTFSKRFSKKYLILNENKINWYTFNNIKLLLITKYLNGKIFIENMHMTEIGDKFASRHGQKGIIGNFIRKEDTPFSILGNTPDILMNPHGIPSRMTIGQILETIISKALVYKGILTIERSRDFFFNCFLAMNNINDFLVSKNESYYGKETLICGINNKPISTNIYMGPVFYQKLNHLATNKIFARGYGKRNLLTRQPSKGKKNEGGLKIGEMEKDCIAAYGCSIILIERILKNSDVFKMKINKLDGYSTNEKGYNNHAILLHYLKLPYSIDLLLKELEAVCISIRVQI